VASVQEHLTTKIEDEYDVVVCGGGFAGMSASLAAARNGAKTLLVERQFLLGGLGTAGLVTIYLPLCDGMGHQVSFGIAEELLKLSVKYGAECDYPDNWFKADGVRNEHTPRYLTRYNPHVFAICAEKLLQDAGVDILYGSSAVGIRKEENRIKYIIIENKSGRCAYGANSVVDATGDADIAFMAGAPTEEFAQGNLLAAWYYSVGKNGYELNSVGCADTPEEEKTEGQLTPMIGNKRYGGLDAKELSEMTLASHRATLEHWLGKRETDPTVWPVTVSSIPQLRMTRKLVGEYYLSHKETGKYFGDSVGMVSDWKKRGPVYEVPFSTLYNQKVKNLICAGRCSSVTQTMWDIMRVIPCCAVTGQAAGTAAAMGEDFCSLDINKLQERLVSNGVVLHLSDIGL